MLNVDLCRICEHAISAISINETIGILYTVHLIYSEMNQEQEIKHQPLVRIGFGFLPTFQGQV